LIAPHLDKIFDSFGTIGLELIQGVVLAAQAMGADFAYIGSAFIATHEARASDAYKQAIVDGNSDDIVYSNLFTGVHGNYLAPSIRAAGLDPDHLHRERPEQDEFCGRQIQSLERHLGLRAGHWRGDRGAKHGRTGGAAERWVCVGAATFDAVIDRSVCDL
jgi:NAD(P)H-dependent flavin oxidoreductase YrpB (nitropropane dioxygenase family)